MNSSYDAVVIGAGPAGEVAASRLGKQGMRVALIERELVGGECAYWACIPSKTLLRPPEARAQADRAPGVTRPDLQWEKIAAYRDYMIRGLDDSKQVAGYQADGIDVYKGEATITGPGTIDVGAQTLRTDRIIIATGSRPVIPAIAGLAEAGYWTNREATTFAEPPDSVVVLGGGPVGVELSQLLARLGATVTLVHSHARLLPREEPAVGDLIEETLRGDGIELRLDQHAVSVTRSHGQRHVTLSSGEVVSATEVIVAVGRRPGLDNLGLENIGLTPGPRGIDVDAHCRATDGVWAIGDVTGVMPFTHVGMYQARIAAADISGAPAHASYEAIPRVVFSDPEVAAVGLTSAKAREHGIATSESSINLPEAIARPWTYEQDPRGTLGLVADRERDVLVGAWAVAPLASEWIHQAALAIKTQTPLAVLTDTVAQFPTFTEAYLKALEALEPTA